MRDLEKTILNLNFEKADLVQQLETLATSKPSTETETKLHTTFTLSDSMAQQYDDLHEKVDALETQNVILFFYIYFNYVLYFFRLNCEIN